MRRWTWIKVSCNTMPASIRPPAVSISIAMYLGAMVAGLHLSAAETCAEPADLELILLNNGVYMLEGGGGNVGVSAGEEGILLVDGKTVAQANGVRDALAHFGEHGPRYILNTHFHPDHTGGNRVFGPEVPIIAHANTRNRLSVGAEFGKRYFEPSPTDALPTITFEHSLSLHFNGEEIKAIHFPHGHTDGDIAVFFTASNVVHLGDLFFNGLFPFIDLDYGGNVASLTRHIAGLIEQLPHDVKIIPGHGPPATLDDLRAYHSMLLATTESVRREIEAGRSLAQIKEAGLDRRWATWSWPFVPTARWVEILYWGLANVEP